VPPELENRVICLASLAQSRGAPCINVPRISALFGGTGEPHQVLHRARARHACFEIIGTFDASGSKNTVQSYGSAESYARRYALLAALNIVTTDVDDDGTKAGAEEGLSVDQERILRELLKSKNRDEAKFCAYAKIEGLGDLPATRFEAACNYVKGLET
jgi:ERF superfamily protein